MDQPKKPNVDNDCDAHKYTVDALDSLSQSQKRIESTMTRMEVVQAEQAKDIEHHIARTDALQAIVGDISKSLGKIEASRNQVIGAVKILAGLSSLGAFAKLLSMLF